MASIPVPSDNASLPDVIRAVRNLFRGKSNNTGQVELTTGTSTPLAHPCIGPTSAIPLVPLTASAAASDPTLFVASQGGAAATLEHEAGPAGRRYAYAVIG